MPQWSPFAQQGGDTGEASRSFRRRRTDPSIGFFENEPDRQNLPMIFHGGMMRVRKCHCCRELEMMLILTCKSIHRWRLLDTDRRDEPRNSNRKQSSKR
jgi:hypothetical protein